MFEKKFLKIKPPLAPTPPQGPHYKKDGFSDPKALRALVALMNMEAVMGGAASHWGGPSALAELVSALYGIVFSSSPIWYDHFHIINDIGHCENIFYAVKANYGFSDLSFEKLRKFRCLGSPLTGHGEVHLFPQAVYLSNGPLGSTLAQAQGLSFADRLFKRKRICVTFVSDGGLMEGEAKEALAAISGLAQKNKISPFVLIISDNNTKLSGRIDEEAFSMSPTFLSLENLGWKVKPLEKAHDLNSCVTTLKESFEQVRKTPQKPIVIWAKTTKGYGVKQTSESLSGGHGFSLKNPSELYDFLKEIYEPEKVPEDFLYWIKRLEKKASKGNQENTSEKLSSVYEKVQVGISQALIEKAQKSYPIFSLSSDLYGSTGLGAFQKKFPERSQDLGVAESNMISMAAGLSKQGLIPIVDTFAQFGTTKGALPLLMASLSQAPLIAIFSHIGFQDAADGASHQSLNYLSFTCSLPYTEVYTLSCSQEAYELVGEAVEKFYRLRQEGKTPPHFIFFLGREVFPRSYKAIKEYRLGKLNIVCHLEDPDLLLIASGTLVPEAILAHRKLKQKNIRTLVLHPSCINNPDINTLKPLVRKTPRLVTIEDHQVKGGMGSYLISALKQKGLNFSSTSFGVEGKFGQSAYTAKELYKQHGLDSDSLALKVESFLKKAKI